MMKGEWQVDILKKESTFDIIFRIFRKTEDGYEFLSFGKPAIKLVEKGKPLDPNETFLSLDGKTVELFYDVLKSYFKERDEPTLIKRINNNIQDFRRLYVEFVTWVRHIRFLKEFFTKGK